MSSITKKLSNVISKESKKNLEKTIDAKKVVDIVTEMKEGGLIKQQQYNLPMADTIGKIYYSSMIVTVFK